MADCIVDDLREHVPRGPVDYQPRPARAAGDPLAYPQVPPNAAGRGLVSTRTHPPRGACVRPGLGASHDLLTSLPDLAADLLTLIPHALALVRVRLAELTDSRRHLAHQLLVDALDHEPGGSLHTEGDPLRRGDGHRVAEAECELPVLALRLDAVTDADNFQRLAVTVGNPGHHVGDQRPRQTMQRTHRA